MLYNSPQDPPDEKQGQAQLRSPKLAWNPRLTSHLSPLKPLCLCYIWHLTHLTCRMSRHEITYQPYRPTVSPSTPHSTPPFHLVILNSLFSIYNSIVRTPHIHPPISSHPIFHLPSPPSRPVPPSHKDTVLCNKQKGKRQSYSTSIYVACTTIISGQSLPLLSFFFFFLGIKANCKHTEP